MTDDKIQTTGPMAKEFGVVVDESKLHTASYDIDITFQVFVNLIRKLDIQ